MLRQIIRNLKPRRFANDIHMPLGFDAWIGVECSEWETVHLRVGANLVYRLEPQFEQNPLYSRGDDL